MPIFARPFATAASSGRWPRSGSPGAAGLGAEQLRGHVLVAMLNFSWRHPAACRLLLDLPCRSSRPIAVVGGVVKDGDLGEPVDRFFDHHRGLDASWAAKRKIERSLALPTHWVIDADRGGRDDLGNALFLKVRRRPSPLPVFTTRYAGQIRHRGHSCAMRGAALRSSPRRRAR